MTQSYTNTMPDSTATFISRDGTRIAYLSVGSGPSVLLLPGALSTALTYVAFIGSLAQDQVP